MSLIGKEITEFEAQAFHENEFKTIKKKIIRKWNVYSSILQILHLSAQLN